MHAVSGAHAVVARLKVIDEPPNPTAAFLESWRRVGGAWEPLPSLDWGKGEGPFFPDSFFFESLLALPSGSALLGGWVRPLRSHLHTPVGPFRLE